MEQLKDLLTVLEYNIKETGQLQLISLIDKVRKQAYQVEGYLNFLKQQNVQQQQRITVLERILE